MDRTTLILGIAGAILLVSGVSVLVVGAQYGFEESLTVDGNQMVLHEDGYVEPSRAQVAPNETITITYTIENDRPIAWNGQVSAYADVMDSRRGAQDHEMLDERVRLEPGQERTFNASFAPAEIGYTSPNPEGYRGSTFTFLIQGPGPKYSMIFVVTDDPGEWAAQSGGFPVAEAAAGASILTLLIVTLTEAGRYWLVRLIAAPFYSRLEPEELAQHETRKAVLQELEETPGLHLRALARAIDTPLSTVTYHIRRLEEGGLVRSQRDGFKRRLYRTGTPDEAGPEDLRSSLLHIIRSNPGLSQAEAARRLGTSRQLVHYHLQRLIEEGEVQQDEEAGNKTRLYPEVLPS